MTRNLEEWPDQIALEPLVEPSECGAGRGAGRTVVVAGGVLDAAL